MSANAVLIVLPFQTPADAGEDGAVAQGLLEDVTSELSRFAGIQVMSWSVGAAVAELSDAEIRERLGVSHVLRGSLRRAGARLRIAVGLVDCRDGTQRWSERFDVPAEALFEVQDDIVGRIAATLVARLEETAVRDALRRPASSLAAYELTLRGLSELREGSFESDESARALFRQAIELDPFYARAHAGLSLSYFNEWSCHYWTLFHENGRLAYQHAHRALELDDRDAMVHVVVGRMQLFRRDFERASWYFDRALALCPHDAELLVQVSVFQVFLGRPDAALAHVERAMRLNPYHSEVWHGYAAFALLLLRRFDEAFAALERSGPVPIVDLPAYTAVALAHQGRMAEASEHLERYGAGFRELITLGREPEPGEQVRWLLDYNPYRRQEDLDFLLDGLRLLERAGADLVVAPAPAPKSEATAPSRFVRLGEGWVVAFDGRQAMLPDLKGLADIHRLLERPGEEVHCLDLAERLPAEHGGDAVLDDAARAALKARIRDLQEDLAEAEEGNDIGRAERLRAEFDALVEALSRALGLGGRSRRLGSLAERARSTVTWRIRHAVRRIHAVHPALSRHLALSVRTGTFCSYDPERAVNWQLTPGSASALATSA
jgi:TolB-like protein/tetratricopeptide (TPR) repeat protein